MSRPLCLNCTLKHLSQAVVLMGEVEKGYPMHKYIAMGHLAEAEDECVAKYDNLAKAIREVRLNIQNENSNTDILPLIEMADSIKNKNGSGCETC